MAGEEEDKIPLEPKLRATTNKNCEAQYLEQGRVKVAITEKVTAEDLWKSAILHTKNMS